MTLSGFIVAMQLMTRLPMPRIDSEAGGDIARAAPWLPVAGAFVGAVVALVMWAGAGLGPSVAALLGLVAWVIVTGALHLDGLGDVADGLGASHRNPDRFIEVARDPHVGGFGAAAMMLQLIAKVVLLAEVVQIGNFAAPVLIAAWARWGALLLARAVPPLTNGLGSRLAKGATSPAVVIEAIVLAAFSLVVAPVLIAAVAVSVALALYWRRRLGGMTGDCHGASIEVSETVLLFLFVAAGV